MENSFNFKQELLFQRIAGLAIHIFVQGNSRLFELDLARFSYSESTNWT